MIVQVFHRLQKWTIVTAVINDRIACDWWISPDGRGKQGTTWEQTYMHVGIERSMFLWEEG